jgi:hypothetical protein
MNLKHFFQELLLLSKISLDRKHGVFGEEESFDVISVDCKYEFVEGLDGDILKGVGFLFEPLAQWLKLLS